MAATYLAFPPLRRNNPSVGSRPSIFLAGSIEMGKAVDWQSPATDFFMDLCGIIYNPRRKDWDSSWQQSIDHPEFNGQVNWELDYIAESEFIFFVFDPNTQSPITLMELGIAASTKPASTVVCCPNGYWRKGNVDIICDRNNITVTENFNDALDKMGSLISAKYKKLSIKIGDDFHRSRIKEHKAARLKCK